MTEPTDGVTAVIFPPFLPLMTIPADTECYARPTIHDRAGVPRQLLRILTWISLAVAPVSMQAQEAFPYRYRTGWDIGLVATGAALFATEVPPALGILAGGRFRPGRACAGCATRQQCPGLRARPGLLGVAGWSEATRALAPSDLTRYSMTNRRVYLRAVADRGAAWRMLGASFDGDEGFEDRFFFGDLHRASAGRQGAKLRLIIAHFAAKTRGRDGEFFPPEEIRKLYNGDYPPESAMIIGTEGALLIQHAGNHILLPVDKFKDQKDTDLEQRNHYHHFIDDCLGGERTESHFTQTGPMTEAILLGTVAIRVPGVLLVWDASNMKFPNYPEAEKLLHRTYREGWKIAEF